MKKSILTSLLLTLISTQLFAVNLCDDECTVVIDFPDGGTLTALEPMTITFGDNGLVDYVSSSTAYTDGNTLSLNADEVLTFGVGGSIDIGDAGNIEYGSLAFSTPSEFVMTVVAEGETETISVENVTISGDAVFEVEAETLVLGALDVDGGLEVLAESGEITQTGPISITGNSSFSALTDITLDNGENEFGGSISLHGRNIHIVCKNSLSFGSSSADALTASTTNGSITQVDAISVSGASVFDATAGNIVLTADNELGGYVSVSGELVLVNEIMSANLVSLSVEEPEIRNEPAKETDSGSINFLYILLINVLLLFRLRAVYHW